MGKLILVLLAIVLACVSSVSTVSAKKPKFKPACFSVSSDGGINVLDDYVIYLATKSSGIKVRDIDDRVPIYSVFGFWGVTGQADTISGSGHYYITNNKTAHVMRMEISGYYPYGDLQCRIDFFNGNPPDQPPDLPTAFCKYDTLVGEEKLLYYLTEVDCSNYDFNGSAPAP